MYTATANVVLPTTITGSLPRPSWYTENLGRRSFREAMVDRVYREQYLDAASAYIRDQELAGLDIVTDGDCRFDADVGGHNWFSYAPIRIDGFSGAEIEQAVVAALYEAHAERKALDSDAVQHEMARTRPLSVVMAEKVAELRAWARSRAMPAD